MNAKHLLVMFVIGSLMLSACQTAAATETTELSESTETTIPATKLPFATDTAVPTLTPVPSETPLPTVTALPEGVIFRDDFEGSLQPGWTWENENPARWTFTDDGWLQIIGENDSLLASRQSNLLWHALPEGDFIITAHLKTKPFANFHQAAIFIYEDADNYITINRGYCDICPTGGGGFYMDYKLSGEWGGYRVPTTAEDVYLRLESKDKMISGYYATEPNDWKRLGRFGNYFQFSKVGIGVSNVGAAEDVIGLFDYFEIALP